MSSFQPTGESWRGSGAASGPRAGFWKRFFADFVDGVVLLILSVIVQEVTHLPTEVVLFVVTVVYCTLMEGGRRGQTLGKSALRIRVASIDDGTPIGYQRALIRSLGRIVSSIPFYLGYLWMLWSPERQTWHDMMARAVVVPVGVEPRAPW